MYRNLLIPLDGSDASKTGLREVVRIATPASLFATSRPGVFAVGDVRAGSVKRVASAVGEGSVVIANVWEYVQHASV